MNSNLDVLRKKRQRWVDANRENRFEAGILRILTQLYPDNAHFIYELLQNAEDAGATQVQFTLSDASLVAEHDGARLFSERDVESITGIGDSTKLDAPTQIGKFGVGFKAVFAYTHTPVVHSGSFHFQIRDLVVPEEVEAIDLAHAKLKTRFIFPFDHSKKKARQAVNEIEKALQNLSAATLLFLTNIRRIHYALQGGGTGGLERARTDGPEGPDGGEHIEVSVRHPRGSTTTSHWLRYQSTLSISDESQKKDCAIAVAFGLEQDEGKSQKAKWKIVPLDPGYVSIYFPAEKETSNLHFHLHAPFASTVARDSVRACEGNNQLRDGLAELVANSLGDIRDRDLLSVSALEALPIKDDNLPEFYEPVRAKIVEAFLTQNLVPTKTGEHRKCENLFRGPSDLINLISDEDLATITGGKWATPIWAANPSQRNQRADKFLDSLSIEEWGWPQLAKALDCDSLTLRLAKDADRPLRLKAWLEPKDDAWLQKFYALLHETTTRHYHSIDAAELPFVRVEGDGNVELVRPKDAYFPPSDEDWDRDDVRLVKPATYSSGKSEAQRSAARLFLEGAGVRVFNEEADFERVIESYKEGSFPDDKTHLEHIKRFIAFFRAHPKNLEVFRSHQILQGTKPGNEENLFWCKTDELCLDSPFEDTGLSTIVGGEGKFVLWDRYAKLGVTRDFTEFAKSIGVQSGLSIVRGRVSANPFRDVRDELRQDYNLPGVRWTDTAIDIDWTIEGIDGFVHEPTIESSRLIWNAIIQADKRSATARFRPNQQYAIREADSQLVCWLKANPWIPDVDGAFHRPQDITRTSLRADFPYDNRNGFLSAIGFEDNFQKLTDEYQRKEQVARDLGFDDFGAAALIARAMEESGIDAKDAAALIKQHAPKPVQPEEVVRNPKRRRAGVLERRENAPEQASVKRERSIQPGMPEVVAQAKAYLRAKYTNPNGQMVCQACQDEMPFKLSSDDYYFEAVQCVRRLGTHYFENRLALCPTCSAMYQHARAESDDDLKQMIVDCEIKPDDVAAKLDVRLAGKTCTMRFVGTHFFDLKTVLTGPEDV